MDFGVELKRPKVLWRQVYDQFRRKILSGDLPPGTKLPSTAELARKTGTDVKTVHRALTDLVSEGLLTRARKVGTHVAHREIALKRIGIYHQTEVPVGSTSFLLSLQAQIQTIARARAISVRVWTDLRKLNRQDVALPELDHAARDRAIQGLIAMHFSPIQAQWLNQLPIPVTGLSNLIPATVDWHFASFMEESLATLQKQGCRSVGLITPFYSHEHLFQTFPECAAKLGMEAHEPWLAHNPAWRRDDPDFLTKDHLPETQELLDKAGFDCTRKFCAHHPRPDGLIVYPDGIAHGTIMGLLAERVRIPEDLRVVLHQHRENPYFCPLAVSFTRSSIREMALALINQIDRMLKGREVQPVLMRFQASE